jgi:hypothetical protein
MLKDLSENSSIQFPAQKKGLSAKNEQWKIDCIDAGEYMSIYSKNKIRKSYYNKKINYDLYNDIIEESDITKIADPYKLGIKYQPNKIQNYPLINPKIDLLVGEEAKRTFDWAIRMTNEAPLIEKRLADTKEIKEFLVKLANSDLSEEEIKEEIEDFHRYINFTKKDFREMAATYILKHLEQQEQFKIKFNNGMKDALISAEEIYQWEIVSGEPKLIKLNPLNTHVVLSGDSHYIEDADIIAIDGYYSPGQIQDRYYDQLSDKEITQIEEAVYDRLGGTSGAVPDAILDRKSISLIEDAIHKVKDATDYSETLSPMDEDGNLRVVKVYWKSKRKMKIVTAYDAKGREIKKLMPEYYKLAPGETQKIIWISEWYEGHKIYLPNQKAIYTNIKIKDVQYRNLNNPSICYPGIIGTIYTVNNQPAQSFMDKGKPYQYLYNVLMNNIESLIATNWGKILKIPLHEIPDGWDVDKWLAYAKTFKAVPTDLFKEGKKGAAIGKIAGGLQQNAPFLDMEVGNSINLYVQMAAMIEDRIGMVLGVTRAREGQISRSELVGNTERQVVQSSHITEYYFLEHEYLKKRVMLAGIETAKIAWKGTKKLNVIFDDFTRKLVEIDMDQIRSIEYDLTIDGSFKTTKINNLIEQLAQAAFQNQMIDYASFIDILQTDSIAEKKRKLQELQEQRKKEAQEARKQEIQAAQQAEAQKRKDEFDIIKYKEEQANKRKAMEINARFVDNDRDNDGIADTTEVQQEQIKKETKLEETRMKLEHDSIEREKDRKLKEKELSIEEKKLKNETKNK